MDIYYLNITPFRNKINFINNLENIDEERKAKIERYKQTDDKLRSLGAGILLNYIREKYNISDKVLVEKYGKPYFESNKIYFNLSHSGNFVVAAVSTHNVGIDIQRVKEDKHRVAEKNFLPSECNFINAAKDDVEKMERFCQIWTAKEAYLKYIGMGLRKPLNSFVVTIEGEELYLPENKELRLVQFKMDEKYIVTVCGSIEDTKLNIESV